MEFYFNHTPTKKLPAKNITDKSNTNISNISNNNNNYNTVPDSHFLQTIAEDNTQSIPMVIINNNNNNNNQQTTTTQTVISKSATSSNTISHPQPSPSTNAEMVPREAIELLLKQIAQQGATDPGLLKVIDEGNFKQNFNFLTF